MVLVSNQGDADLHIADLYLDNDSGPFSINVISSPLIPPGGQAQFAVTFSPETAATNEGFVYIDSDDPDTPTTEVALIGSGIAPIIDVSPTSYDFGELYVGCDKNQPLTEVQKLCLNRVPGRI